MTINYCRVFQTWVYSFQDDSCLNADWYGEVIDVDDDDDGDAEDYSFYVNDDDLVDVNAVMVDGVYKRDLDSIYGVDLNLVLSHQNVCGMMLIFYNAHILVL